MASKSTRPASSTAAGLEFNHAMIYTRDVPAALRFYADFLGFETLEVFRAGDVIVYARLKSPRGNTTIALHAAPPNDEFRIGGMRLYFEVKDLDRFCKKLETAGIQFSQPPKVMPWGWRHAYLNDPDGREVSLYSAGAKRLKKVKRDAGANAALLTR